jgi:RNA polymerase sigma factor (sigma-70 family)
VTRQQQQRSALAAPRLDEESEAQVALAVLYGRYNDMLVQYLRRQARCRETAEDLAQQLWLKLLDWTRQGRFMPADEPGQRAFLFSAARNLFVDECVRKHAVSRTSRQPHEDLERELAERGSGGPGPDELVAQQQVGVLVARALATLPGCQREVVQLWMQEASIEGMVEATRAPRDTVLSRKKYGFRRLRGALEALA